MLFMIVTNVSLVRKMKVLRKERNSFKCDKIRNRSEDGIHFEGEGGVSYDQTNRNRYGWDLIR